MKTHTMKNTIYTLAILFAVMILGGASAQAAVYTVTNTNDSGAGSLRDAITAANGSPDNDTINFDATAFAGSQTITLTSGELVIDNNGTLTINGTGANRLSISGNNTSQVFLINSGAVAAINNLTVTNGNTSNFIGGGIFNDGGTLTLTNSIVSNNTARSGGGIFNNAGTLTLTNSTVSNNYASEFGGGGIGNTNGTLTLTGSTVSGNSAEGFGGGIAIQSGTLTLINSTVNGNSAQGGGGIVNSEGTATLTNSTVSGNTSELGGGIFTLDSFGTVNASNSIIAGNTASSAPDFFGTLNSQGYNLIGNVSAVSAFTQMGDQTGNSTTPLDPKLATLADNGGATRTHALLAGSPALDKGAAATDPIAATAVTTDQHASPRPVDLPDASYPNATGGDGSDIGAFEAQALTAATVSISGRVTTSTRRGIRGVRITMTDTGGNVRTASSSAFGYYKFENVAAGATYIVTATGKRFTFSQPTQVLNINEDIVGLNFIANPQ